MDGKMSVGGAQDHNRRGDQDEDRENNEGIGPVERQPNDPHGASLREPTCCLKKGSYLVDSKTVQRD